MTENAEKKEKIYEIISKIYEKDEELLDKELEIKIDEVLEKALLNGKIDLFYTITDDGSDFQTIYNLKKEQLEFFIDNEIQETYKLPLNEMIEIADMDGEEFHQEYSSLSLDSKNEKEFENEEIEAKEFYKNQEIRENRNKGVLDKVKNIFFENKEEQIFRIISRNYELLKPEQFHPDLFSFKNVNDLEREFKNEAKESLKNGEIKLFSAITNEGYKFETKYNLKNEKIEVFIGGKLKEATKLKFNDLVEDSHLEKHKFHEKYTKLNLESKKEEKLKNSFLKNVLKKEAKSKKSGLEL